MQNKTFVSIIWGYHKYFYNFTKEEHYHIHALKVAKDMGYEVVVILKGEKNIIENDPIFDKEIKVIYYKNIFNYLFHLIKYSLKDSIFYVNSVEIQSIIVPFICKKTIFMGHTHPKRQGSLKQKIFNFSMSFYKRIRLNNNEERAFLLNQRIKENKLKVVPLSIALKDYYVIDENSARKDLVYFGNITKKKNLETIIKACNIVCEKFPEIKLHLIGKEYDLIKEELISPKLNIVRYGFIKEAKDVNFLLNKFLVYINSSFDEGMCVSVYNASMSGCALCLPNIMSFSGIFENKALFHEVSDFKKLADNIIFYLENRDLCKKYNKECREMILENYSYEKISKQMTDLFKF
jgi:glycosyltransferase involved in cell wall biosynthesis